MTTSNVSAPPAGREDEEEQHRLSALEGLAALSLDALSSVAYGPEAILIVLNAAVGVSAGVDAVTSAFPGLYGARVWLCLAALALITAANFWGVAESARPFIKQRWAQWGAKVPLVTLYSPHRTLGPRSWSRCGRGSGSCTTSAAPSWSGPSGTTPRTWSSAGSASSPPPGRRTSAPGYCPAYCAVLLRWARAGYTL